MTVRTGRCHCEKVKYQMTGEPIAVSNCYCRTCRKVTGGPYFSIAMMLTTQFKLTEGSPSSYKTSAPGMRYFCGNCGANTHDTFELNGTSMTVVTLATLDDGHGLKPSYSMMVKYKPEWLEITDGLPQFEEFPPM